MDLRVTFVVANTARHQETTWEHHGQHQSGMFVNSMQEMFLEFLPLNQIICASHSYQVNIIS